MRLMLLLLLLLLLLVREGMRVSALLIQPLAVHCHPRLTIICGSRADRADRGSTVQGMSRLGDDRARGRRRGIALT